MFFGLLLISCLFSSTCLVFKPCNVYNSAARSEIPHQDYIKINFSSQQELIGTKLREEGLTGALLKGCTDAKERSGLIKRIIDRINAIYRQQGYINSSVKEYRLTDAGKLEIDCSENAIPKSNFRFYIKDPRFGQCVDIKPENIIKKSSSCLPFGRFTQIESDYLAQKLFRGQELIKLDPVIFECIKKTRLYKDLEYVIHKKSDGNVHCDVFCQGFGQTKAIIPALSLSLEREILLNLAYRDANFMDSKSVFRASCRVNLPKLLEYDHALQLQFLSDVVDSALWDRESIDCSLVTVSADSNLAKVMDTGISVALMKRLKGVEFVASGGVDPKTLSVSAGVSKRCQIGHFKTLASLSHSHGKKEGEKTESDKFRIEQRAALNIGKNCRVNAKYIATNKLSHGDFRGKVEGNKRCFIASHELQTQLFKFKISPFAGVFCDMLLEENLDTNISAGIKVTCLNLTLSLPILYILPKGHFKFPKLSKLFKHSVFQLEKSL
ncbi:hypothetical protein BEWA_004550 [Theileria equi strain WA]|uniref:Signal peptide-containing protein n=1 Tax=Theileria equi strain WA TaxID=1537102 RepID=L0AZM4_THEEQ|nr:hypothetical protein BEWA_004550 [Theileria equi strain WA]AFZ81047.1 hypothetical protein BEWA_004550 [Theileria equi strain WA]|eukprot:XP_004830713.1 hypothetical protein BEWA_004550 [Theileria equi strain WA]